MIINRSNDKLTLDGDIMEIIIERTPKGWTVADAEKKIRQYVTSKQMNKLFSELKEEKFNSVYYSRTSDFLRCRKSCKRTGRKSGTRRSRLSLMCSVMSFCLKS